MNRLAAVLIPAALLTVATSTAPVDAAHYLDQFIDTKADPRNDFWEYSVGKWLKDNPIPKSERSWGVYNVIQNETYQRLSNLSKSAAASKNSPKGSTTQKIGDFWFSAMDTTTIAAQGFSPISPEFQMILGIKTLADVSNSVARLQYIGAGPLYGLAIYQDEKHSDHFAVHLEQGGLGMPDRDYYFDADDHGKMLLREYVAHVGRMFALLGDAPAIATANANTVMAIETELARASRKLEDLRDPIKNYNAMPLSGLSALTPSIPWREHLAAGMITKVDTVIVGQPEFFKQVEKSLHAHSVDDWKTYLRWQLAHAYAAEAGGKFDKENFHFFGTILNGTAEQRPRWKRVLDEEEGYLGDALGQLYVAKYFSPRTKQRYQKLTDEIFDAFRARINNLDWMSAPTKQRALVKLNSVTKKVGYPDVWKDYTKYDIDRRSFIGNTMRGRMWQSDDVIAKLHKPVDRREWSMTPQTYNAYYNPANNEIVLPAAIFILPGIADSLVDDAIVYAYAGGTTIGHEITHGFDDQGRQFDEKGNLTDWWTPADAKEFNRRAAVVVRQYSEYVAVGTTHINGSATQGENIADIGGITLAWDAFKKTDEYKSGKEIGGLTPAQRYFIGWSLGWMNQLRPENLAVLVKTDVHSPSPFRTIGPVTSMVPFYEAFGVKPSDKMYRADSVRAKIW
ncbi:MAG: M13 family metallopeptidase [Gemmatimonadaceae bacterium]